MRILFVARRGDHASSRVRALQYVEPLQRLGHEVRVLPWEPATRADVARLTTAALRHSFWADVTMIVKPRLHPAALEAMRRINRSLVVDVDDAMWTWGDVFARRFDDGARRASVITAGSAYLARVLAERYPRARTVRLPTAVTLERYPPRPAHAGGRVPVIGWIGGPASLDDFSEPVLDALRQVTRAGVAQLRIVSSTPLAARDLDASFEPWGIDTEVRSLHGFDLGIMPLHDDEASWGRCGLKAIQYMAVGLPVVASPIGAAPELVEHGVNGFFATTGAEWVEAISSLAESSELRATMGGRARETVEAEFSVAVNAPRLAAALEAA